MSSWWGSSSSSSSSGAADSSSYETGSGDSSYGAGDSFGSDFAASAPSSYAPSGSTAVGGGDPQAALRLALQQEQQKAVVQAAIAKLTELCWETCVGRPEASLSSSEQTCIANCAERYLDTSMFVMGRMSKQHQH